MVGIYDTMTCGGSHLGFPIGIKNRGPSNDHSIFVVSEKKAFEHFPIGSNVNLCPAVVAILDLRSA